MSERSSIEYVASALAYHFYLRDEKIGGPSSLSDLKATFKNEFDHELSDKAVLETASWLEENSFIKLYNDRYAGMLLSYDQNDFNAAYRQFREKLPESILARGWSFNFELFSKVFSQSRFWQDLEDDSEKVQSEKAFGLIPASDRTVTVLHNSSEGADISAGLLLIEDELSTNNQVASDLGEDRDRLLGEVKASRLIIWSQHIRADVLSGLILGFLRELIKRIPEKAASLGVDRIIKLIEKILDHVF
ncbi:hypothetical protein [Sphingomonas profundi]|uniref:hypothetical protein n=1 Tax=Alterirhizorhabdus profundi TaxID=2681549 RepID=UPI0012E8BB2F|nr:hypothetical protein [Sphingomonas profundi]